MNVKDLAIAKRNAKKLGVEIKRSTRKNKKLDVFRKGVKIASIGDLRYNDFHSYKRTKGIEFAKKRQTLYRIRHAKNIKVVGSAGYFANALLWT